MAGSSGTPQAHGTRGKDLKARFIEEMKKYAIVTLYLWVLFALFGMYRKLLLSENGLDPWTQSYAIVNALIFGKVVLLGEILGVGKRLSQRELLFAVIGKAFLFSVLLMGFHIAEEVVRALFKKLPVMDAVLSIGGGSWFGFYVYGAIMFVMLIPLFAARGVADVLGTELVWKLLMSPAPVRDKNGKH